MALMNSAHERLRLSRRGGWCAAEGVCDGCGGKGRAMRAPLTCRAHAVRMLCACRAHAVHMLCACCAHAVRMLCACHVVCLVHGERLLAVVVVKDAARPAEDATQVRSMRTQCWMTGRPVTITGCRSSASASSESVAAHARRGTEAVMLKTCTLGTHCLVLGMAPAPAPSLSPT
eukprot:scaffold28880_cov71-Phaeocystis_antarctica.AAC.2